MSCMEFILSILTMAAPYVMQSEDLMKNLPYLILGSLCLIAGSLNLTFLPETKDKEMPDSIEDVLMLFENNDYEAF